MTRQDNQKSSNAPCESSSPSAQIKHIIVLMLENRSFDHMLGYSGIKDIEGIGSQHLSNQDRDGRVYNVEPNAGQVEDLIDPGHDYVDVFTQMFYEPQQKDTCATEPTMQGFAESYRNYSEEPGDALQCYKPDDLKVLTYLASNFAVCDHWFSSVPGPTLPNRLFAHCGSSKGRLDLSAEWLDAPKTIYEVLDEGNVSSTIYADGWTAAATIPNLLVHQDQFFGTLDDFYQDCADNNLPGYCFLEPRYSSGMVDGTFRPQNDQHPDSDVNEGEHLIYSVYKAIRSHRKVWEHSMLVITYDEHGGLYDHVPPPEAVQPRDNEVSANPYFDFKRYGVRVPAVIVSPYTPAMVSKDIFDHTSLIATARKLLTGKWQDDALGKRAMSANTFDSVLTSCPPRNEHHDFAPRPSAAKPRKAANLNHLQIDHLRQAYLLDQSRAQHLRVNPNPAWVDRLKAGEQDYKMYSDIKVEDVDHYVRSVYTVSRDLRKKKSP